MNPAFRILCLGGLLSLAVGCKTEYEKVRTSGDADLIFETANELYDQGKYAKAQTLYEQVVNAYRGRAELQPAYYKYATTYFETGQFILAAYYFKNYAETYPGSDQRGEAQYMEAMSYVELSPDYLLDQEYTDKAIVALEQYANTYPDSERVPEINALLDELRAKLESKAFAGAVLYFDMQQYQAATQSFERVLQDYPDSDRAQLIRFRIANAHARLADNSVVAKRRERYDDALDAIGVYLKKYPDGSYAKVMRNERERITNLLKDNETYVRY